MLSLLVPQNFTCGGVLCRVEKIMLLPGQIETAAILAQFRSDSMSLADRDMTTLSLRIVKKWSDQHQDLF